MGILRKKKRTISLEKHSGRFNLEYNILPSVATFAPTQYYKTNNKIYKR